MQLFLVSGLSGAGKSIAIKLLEDNGFFCVDNLPVELLPALIQNLQAANRQQVAVSVDVRGGEVGQLPMLIKQLRADGIDARLLFLEARIDELVRRFSETRRRHPLTESVMGAGMQLTLPECIKREHELLADIVDVGHRIDTSDLQPNVLRAWVKSFITFNPSQLTLQFQSFGFKHGIPLDADWVFDVRCLPNPHYDPVLRPLTGKDTPVIEFMEALPLVQSMYADIRDFVSRWLPSFVADNRSYLTIAIGCTGGQHRSVYLVEKLAQHFLAQQQTILRHRELSAP